MSGSVCLSKQSLDVAFLGGLMNTPCLFKACLNILLEEQVSEDKLVLVDGLLGDDKAQWPFNLVVQSKCFIDLHDS